MLVEPDVEGSSPSRAAISGCKSMVDGLLWEQEAGGSNPLTQTSRRHSAVVVIEAYPLKEKENKSEVQQRSRVKRTPTIENKEKTLVI